MDGYFDMEEYLRYFDEEYEEEITEVDVNYQKNEDGFLTNDDNWKNGLGLLWLS